MAGQVTCIWSLSLISHSGCRHQSSRPSTPPWSVSPVSCHGLQGSLPDKSNAGPAAWGWAAEPVSRAALSPTSVSRQESTALGAKLGQELPLDWSKARSTASAGLGAKLGQGHHPLHCKAPRYPCTVPERSPQPPNTRRNALHRRGTRDALQHVPAASGPVPASPAGDSHARSDARRPPCCKRAGEQHTLGTKRNVSPSAVFGSYDGTGLACQPKEKKTRDFPTNKLTN